MLVFVSLFSYRQQKKAFPWFPVISAKCAQRWTKHVRHSFYETFPYVTFAKQECDTAAWEVRGSMQPLHSVTLIFLVSEKRPTSKKKNHEFCRTKWQCFPLLEQSKSISGNNADLRHYRSSNVESVNYNLALLVELWEVCVD